MPLFNHLVIYLTERCNLSCSYCYIKKDYRSTLDFPSVRKAVDLFCQNPEKDKSFTFLGGEPLLAYSLLLKSIDYIIGRCRKDNSRPSFFIFTNATQLDPQKIKDLDRRAVNIIVSLDGQAQSNDIFRKFSGNHRRSVLNAAMERLGSIPRRYLNKLEINMVVSAKTCPYLLDNVKFFYKKWFSSITPTATAYGRWSLEDFKVLESQLWGLAEFYVSLFRGKQRLFKISFIEDLLRGFSVQMSICRRITLGADANFYFCDGFLGAPGNNKARYRIASVDEATLESLSKWVSNCKQKARAGLKRISPANGFRLHDKYSALYCPFGVYHYALVNGYDPKPFMKNFYRMSELYTSIFWWVKETLKRDDRFVKMYSNKT